MRLAGPILALTFALAPGAGTAVAGHPAGASPPSRSILLHVHPLAWRLPAAPRAALRAEVDPVTGELSIGEQGAQDAQAAASARAALAAVPVRVRADGSRSAVLGGLLRAYSVVRIAPDGRLVEDCVDGQDEAMRLLRTPVAPGEGR